MILRFSVALALSLVARTAGAQTITVANESSLPRVDASGNQLAKRATNLFPEAVSYADCIADQRIRLAMTLTDFEANASLQAWAANNGQDCTLATNRDGATKQCWRVVDGDIPLATSTQVDVPVRRIMSGVLPFGPSAVDATANACGKVDLANLGLQLLYFSPGNLSTPAATHTIAVTVDTVGPAAPTGLTALPGDHRIQVTFANISGGSADGGVSGGLTDLTGVNAYCDLAKTVTSPSDAGVADASVTTNACTTTLLVPGAIPDAAQLCGSFAGSTGTTVSATTLGGQELQNEISYAIAVAATDRYGNQGPLSSVLCAIPQETTDFWDNYKAEGGEAGGCASTESPPTGAFVAVLALAGLAAGRRKR